MKFFLKQDILEEDYKKALKKLTLFFLLNPVPFNGQNYQKQKGSETSDQSFFRLRNKFKNIPLFIIYYLTNLDGVIKSSFWVIPKITSANLCMSVDDIINYSTSICPFESRNWKGSEKITKNWISREQKELFSWNKKHFS